MLFTKLSASYEDVKQAYYKYTVQYNRLKGFLNYFGPTLHLYVF